MLQSRTPRSINRRAVTLAFGLSVTLALSACAAADEEEPGLPGGGEEGAAEVNGRFELVDAEQPELAGVVFEFDGDFGGLEVETPCGTLLGSYSVLDDGRAGVTIAGSQNEPCEAAEEAAVGVLVDRLAAIDGWQSVGGDLLLQSSIDQTRLDLQAL